MLNGSDMAGLVALMLWISVGCVVAIPYMFFVNGTAWDFFKTMVIAPAVVVILLVVYAMRGIGRCDNKRPKWGGWLFWTTIVYFCFPILLNGASLLLKWAGYEEVGCYVFKYRFISLMAIPIFILIANIVTILWQSFSGSATSLSNIPPNDGF